MFDLYARRIIITLVLGMPWIAILRPDWMLVYAALFFACSGVTGTVWLVRQERKRRVKAVEDKAHRAEVEARRARAEEEAATRQRIITTLSSAHGSSGRGYP